MYNQEKITNYKSIMECMNERGIPANYSECTFRNIIGKLGFRWRKTQDNRKILMKRQDIKLKRIQYLRQLRQFRAEGFPIYFTDESCIHATHVSCSWSDESGKGVKSSVAKGRRLIMNLLKMTWYYFHLAASQRITTTI